MKNKSNSTTPSQDVAEKSINLDENVYELLGKMATANYRSRRQELMVIILEVARQRGFLIDSKTKSKSSSAGRETRIQRQALEAEVRSLR